MNSKLYSSSATGYVVVPKLVPDTYQMTIGFNKDAYPEQQIRIIVDKDGGYLLKNYGEKGWGFLNLQTGEVVMSSGVKPPDGEDDAFTKTLSQVVNTPDLKGEAKKDVKEVINVPQTDIKPAVVVKTEIQPNTIKLLLNNGDHSGRQMVYLDGTDTIRLFIPGDVITSSQSPAAPAPVVETEIKKEEKTNEQLVLKDAVKVEPLKDTVAAEKTELMPSDKKVNNDNPAASANCALLASNEDFLKLRKKMASEKNDETMINVARKQFKSRCYATEQIKNLSVLFLTDEGRYKFLDTAYPFVHDKSQFSVLESILTDNYYRNRFKAMIRQ